ncbi:MAG: 5-formyltetrahydrofolate cyclo-ligase [Desulfuromusa sp.]|jgi:5-formyltetrahydrofolate cyclo-ligase|nr:5-formyltetrahydrofolate cyclo-ligase [Desulfuromusa sp.]
MGKKSIRKQFLDCRKQLDLQTYAHLSQQVQQQLAGSECFIRARTLALYSPINNEVATEQIFTVATQLNKQIYFSRVAGEELDFFEVNTINELVPGAFGVAEPVSGKKISVAELDLIVVPGVAFDLLGGRLGYGRGFYDRLLAGKLSSTVSVGFCFESQLCDLLPTEAHDQGLDFIATETKFIPCRM